MILGCLLFFAGCPLTFVLGMAFGFFLKSSTPVNPE
jgi:hypothetical protein